VIWFDEKRGQCLRESGTIGCWEISGGSWEGLNFGTTEKRRKNDVLGVLPRTSRKRGNQKKRSEQRERQTAGGIQSREELISARFFKKSRQRRIRCAERLRSWFPERPTVTTFAKRWDRPRSNPAGTSPNSNWPANNVYDQWPRQIGKTSSGGRGRDGR